MRPWQLIAGIVAIAGLDFYVLSGSSFAIVALVAVFALLVVGIEKLRGVPIAKRPVREWNDDSVPLNRRDYIAMTACGISSFLLSIAGYWRPPEKIFDEVYFARAAEEYLRNARIYENTHPPLRQ
ncbi:MAG TPA: hypothetical protein VFE36_02595 [Candidatus Baltobacteraceae bacterium]|jgi:hypothetical protein|nr:hypothetical protein [Candidatus Baltobacteraceae bacterium]